MVHFYKKVLEADNEIIEDEESMIVVMSADTFHEIPNLVSADAPAIPGICWRNCELFHWWEPTDTPGIVRKRWRKINLLKGS